MDTWEKRLRLGGKSVSKRAVRDHYVRQWRSNKEFREAIRGKPLTVFAKYGNKDVVRRGARVRSERDLIEVIRQHGVQFAVDSKPFLDIDVPKKLRGKAVALFRTVEKEARTRGLRVKEVVSTPNGRHYVFQRATRGQVTALARGVASQSKEAVVGRHSASRFVLDSFNAQRVAPGSLGRGGGLYRRLR